MATFIGPSHSVTLEPLVIVPPTMIALSVSTSKYIPYIDDDITTPFAIYSAVQTTSSKQGPGSAPPSVTTHV